jgi:hypothetical protein
MVVCTCLVQEDPMCHRRIVLSQSWPLPTAKSNCWTLCATPKLASCCTEHRLMYPLCMECQIPSSYMPGRSTIDLQLAAPIVCCQYRPSPVHWRIIKSEVQMYCCCRNKDGPLRDYEFPLGGRACLNNVVHSSRLFTLCIERISYVFVVALQ